MRVYEITPDKDCNSHTENNLKDAIDTITEWLKESEDGVQLSVEVKEMSQLEYDHLPEYEGP